MRLFDYLGAFYFWIYLVFITKIRNRKSPTFTDIRRGKDRYQNGDLIDLQAYYLKLKIIGFTVSMIILHLIVKSGI